MTLDVGKRLRTIRTDKGLSQRKLATRAGVTNGLISLIEQNRTSPSIASLKLILDAIPMSFTEFFDVAEIDPDKFVFRADEMLEINPLRVFGTAVAGSAGAGVETDNAPIASGVASAETGSARPHTSGAGARDAASGHGKTASGAAEPGGISFRRVGRSTDHALQMLHETYAAGADTGEELYSHEAEEAGLVISGQIEITVGGEVALLEAGDSYLFDSRKPHRFRNPGTTVCVIVSACTPPTF